MKRKIYNNYTNEELFWFFNEAESDMGYSSNYSSFLFMMEGGISSNYSDPEDAITDKHIHAASRYKKISRKLTRLNKRQQYILQLYFTVNAMRHPSLKNVFDDALPVMFLDYSPRQLGDIAAKKKESKSLRDQYRKEIKQCLISYQSLS